MSTTLILDSAWLSYDEYKISKGQNPDIFIPNDRYESDFLIKRISSHFPQYTELVIELAINSVKRTLYSGCKRSLFISLVISNLLQRKPMPAL